MRRTYIKDILRNIRAKFIPFLSAIFITALAVVAYLGMTYGAAAMRMTAEKFFQAHQFRDLEMYCTKLFTQKDLEAISALEEVRCAEGVLQTDGQLRTESLRMELTVVSLTHNVNQTELLDGKLPEAAEECAIEKELAEAFDLHVGDTFSVEDHEGKCPAYLKGQTFTVTGIVVHPDHYLSRRSLDLPRYVLVTEDAFDRAALENRFIKIVLTLESSEEPYSDAYYREVSALKAKLEGLCDQQREVFWKERTDANVQIAVGEERLRSSKEQLENGSEKLTQGKTELEEKKAELKEGEKALQEGKDQLTNSEKTLQQSKAELDAGKAKLDASRKQLEEGKARLDIAKEQLDDAEKTLSEKRQQLDDAEAQLNAAEAELRQGFDLAEEKKDEVRGIIKNILGENGIEVEGMASPITDYDLLDPNLSMMEFRITDSFVLDLNQSSPDLIQSIKGFENELMKEGGQEPDQFMMEELESRVLQLLELKPDLLAWESGHQQYINGYQEYQDGLAQWEEGNAKYQSSLQEYQENLAVYEAGYQEYQAGLAKYQSGEKAYTDGLEDYKNGLRDYEKSSEEYISGSEAIEDAKTQVQDNEEQLASGEAAYESGVQELESARTATQMLDGTYRWILLNVKESAIFYAAQEMAEGIQRMAMMMGMLFVFVGAMVLYSTIARMIADQQKQVGTVKALGFHKIEILGKYEFYAASAVVIGISIGILLAYYVVQPILIDLNIHLFVIQKIEHTLIVRDTIVTVVLALLLSFAAVFFACSSLLAQPARDLLAGNIVTEKRKKVSQHGMKMPLYFRLIVRNIMTDSMRVVVTIVSVAGCCVLMVVGLTFSSNLSLTVTRHFQDIIRYDHELAFDPEISASAEMEMRDLLEEGQYSYVGLYSDSAAYTIDDTYGQTQLICGDPSAISRFLHLTSVDGKAVQLPEEGILLSHGLAEANDLREGDTLILYNSKMEPFTVKIAGTFRYYLGRCMLLSDQAYTQIFGEKPVHNRFWIQGEQALPDALTSVRGYLGENSMDLVRNDAQDYLSSSIRISFMLIGIAGLMALFIILDLVNMYVMKKKRELVVMRINGFTLRETILYAALECIVTTIIGIILGLLIGSVLGDFMLKMRENSTTCFVHGISLTAWAIAAAVTLAYAVGIHFMAFRKIKHYQIASLTS